MSIKIIPNEICFRIETPAGTAYIPAGLKQKIDEIVLKKLLTGQVLVQVKQEPRFVQNLETIPEH